MATTKLYQAVLCLLFVFFLDIFPVFAQLPGERNRQWPVGMVNFKEGDMYIKVTYGRPKMKYELSPVFGYQVPWRKLWRTGGDEATEISISKQATLNGTLLEAGTYTLFTIPDTAEWTVILNAEPGQWGHFKYDPEKDVLKTKVPLYRSPKVIMELTMYIEDTPAGADIILMWNREAIRLPLAYRQEE